MTSVSHHPDNAQVPQTVPPEQDLLYYRYCVGTFAAELAQTPPGMERTKLALAIAGGNVIIRQLEREVRS